MMEWQLQEAKNRLSQVVQEARSTGPQIITLRGKRAAVVLSFEEFERLQSDRPSFIEYLKSGPEWDDELIKATIDARDDMPDRDVDL